MTQPVHPVFGLPAGAAPVFQMPEEPAPGAPGQGARVPFPEVFQTGSQYAQQVDEQRRLEDENGWLGTVALQATKGFLDAVMAPGALFAAGTEGMGRLLGSTALEQFGRDLGQAASGRSAIEAATFVAGGGGREGLKNSQEAVQKADDQRKAWPTLSTMAEFAGNAVYSLATGMAGAGAGAGAQATTRAIATVGAFEGSGYGAQEAYAVGAPLSDLMVATVAGGALGGVLGLGMAEAPKIVKRVVGSSTFRDTLESASARSALKAAVDRQSELSKMVGRKGMAQGTELLERVGRDIRDFRFSEGPRAGEGILSRDGVLKMRSREEVAQVLQEATEETGAKLGAFRQALDAVPTTERPDAVALLQRIRSQVINPIEEQVGGMADREAQRALRDVYDRLRPLTDMFQFRGVARDAQGRAVSVALTPDNPAWWRSLERVAPGSRRLGFEEVGSWRKQLADRVYPKPMAPGVAPPVPRSALELQKLERTIEGYLTEATDAAMESTGRAGEYQAIKSQYQSLKMASQAAQKSGIAQIGNRFISASDYMTSIGGGLAGVATGGPLLGAVTGAASALGHKWLRENGRTVMALLLQRAAAAMKYEVSTGVSKAFLPGLAAKAAVRSALPSADEYLKRVKYIQDAAQDPTGTVLSDAAGMHPAMNPELSQLVTTGMAQRMANLARDLPKPTMDPVRGPSISRRDVARGTAMISATLEPMSVFEDLRSGQLDVDKAEYAWRQYPGLQSATQVAVVDKLMAQMDQEERSAIPSQVLRLLDFACGFGGKLQSIISPAVAGQLAALQAAPPPSQPLTLPGAKPTPVGKLMQS